VVDKNSDPIRLYSLLIGGLLSSFAMGCELQKPVDDFSGHDKLNESTHTERMTVLDQPPVIAANSHEKARLAKVQMDRLDLARMARRSDAALSATDALPYLSGSPQGRAFLASPLPRAMARGMPAEFCPADFTQPGQRGMTRSQTVLAALEGCLAKLSATHPECGCRVVAVDNVVTVPRKDLAYATGIGARLLIPGLGINSMIIAEEDNDEGLLLRDLHGPVAHINHGPGDSVTVMFIRNGTTFTGRYLQVGFRRGRIAERIYAKDAEGHKLSLLIGFDPEELAQNAARWLVWPQD